jgi:hypothetical protein
MVRPAILTASFALLTLPARAEVCDKERPFWSPADGPAGMIDEFVTHATSPAGIVLGLLFLASLFIANTPLRILTILLAVLSAGALIWPDGTGITTQAIAEGCVGNALLSIAACTAIFLVTLVLALRSMRARK